MFNIHKLYQVNSLKLQYNLICYVKIIYFFANIMVYVPSLSLLGVGGFFNYWFLLTGGGSIKRPKICWRHAWTVSYDWSDLEHRLRFRVYPFFHQTQLLSETPQRSRHQLLTSLNFCITGFCITAFYLLHMLQFCYWHICL